MPPINLSQYDDIIEAKARQYGLPAALVRSVIWQESRGNSRAVSPVGAQGLMQLMPGTADQLGVKNAFDPVQNIDGGVRYLKQQISKFGLEGGIAAYNAGPGNVMKYKGVPPFKETQQYVKNILGTYQGQGGDVSGNFGDSNNGGGPLSNLVSNIRSQYGLPQSPIKETPKLSLEQKLAEVFNPNRQESILKTLWPKNTQQDYAQSTFNEANNLASQLQDTLQNDIGIMANKPQAQQDSERALLIAQGKLTPYKNSLQTMNDSLAAAVSGKPEPGPDLWQRYKNQVATLPINQREQLAKDPNQNAQFFQQSTGWSLPEAAQREYSRMSLDRTGYEQANALPMAFEKATNTPMLPKAITDLPGKWVGGVTDETGKLLNSLGIENNLSSYGQGAQQSLDAAISDFTTPRNVSALPLFMTPAAPAAAAYFAPQMAKGTYDSVQALRKSLEEGDPTAIGRDATSALLNTVMAAGLGKSAFEGFKPYVQSGIPYAKRLGSSAGEWFMNPKVPEGGTVLGSGFGGLQGLFERGRKGGPAPTTEPVTLNTLPPPAPEAASLGGKERGFVTTIKESPNSPKALAEGVQGRYEPITKQATLEAARARIQADPLKARDEILLSSVPSAVDVATGIELIRKYNREGDFSQSIDIAQRLAERATKTGQEVWAYSLYDELGPEGLQKLAERTTREAREALPNYKKVKLEQEIQKISAASPDLSSSQVFELAAENLKLPHVTPEFAKSIYERASALEALPEGSKQRVTATAEILRDIAGLVPSSKLRKISTIQAMGQLLNPKTVIRNFLGNAAFAVAENFKDAVAAPLDKAVSLITGERTKAFPGVQQLKAQVQGFNEGLRQGFDNAWKGIDISRIADKWEINKSASGLPQGPTFRGKGLNTIEKVLNVVLKAPDQAFYRAAFNKSIAEQMSLKGVEKATPEMIANAHLEGIYKTFQDESKAAVLFSGIKRSLNFGKEFGAGDFLLKYPKTPGNLLARSYDYSPLGFVTSLTELGKAITNRGFDQKTFVDYTSRALVGSAGLTALGYILSQNGLLRNSPIDNKNAEAVSKTVGLNKSQLNTTGFMRWVTSGFDPKEARMKPGDSLFTYDWILPLFLPVTVGAKIQETGLKEGSKSVPGVLAQGLESAIDTFGEQPLIKSLTDLGKNKSLSSALEKLATGIPASFTPTFLNQISDIKDNISRNTYDENPIKQALNVVVSKTPFSDRLPARVDPFGDEIKMYQNDTNSVYNVMFNPAFKSTYQPTPYARLAANLYQMTGESGALPKTIGKKVTISGIERQLSGQEQSDLQKWIGARSKKMYSALAADPQFLNLPQNYQAKYIARVNADLIDVAKVKPMVDELSKMEPNQQQEYLKDLVMKHGLTEKQYKELGQNLNKFQYYNNNPNFMFWRQ